MRKYTAVFVKEPEGHYFVEIPAFGNCFTEGDTYEEALANIQEVLQLIVGYMRDHGEPLPEDIRVQTLSLE